MVDAARDILGMTPFRESGPWNRSVLAMISKVVIGLLLWLPATMEYAVDAPVDLLPISEPRGGPEHGSTCRLGSYFVENPETEIGT
jgi:hypothetical protein